ncbi:Aste57867_20732 [Aphanomyces stellatus]|uniref:Aste57867_20732 protein n=1 Tax=Aphanomyces stellatus TaxID=120398 RepID=A0A485LFN9_9STRA|nr:hypothetical protein As57867_020664 [Aphanomyces stellatus]VFT97412.1 Aste57867_20732 [Aphanomyces stellatus]
MLSSAQVTVLAVVAACAVAQETPENMDKWTNFHIVFISIGCALFLVLVGACIWYLIKRSYKTHTHMAPKLKLRQSVSFLDETDMEPVAYTDVATPTAEDDQHHVVVVADTQQTTSTTPSHV